MNTEKPPFAKRSEISDDERRNMHLTAMKEAQRQQRESQLELIRLEFACVWRRNCPGMLPEDVMFNAQKDLNAFVKGSKL